MLFEIYYTSMYLLWDPRFSQWEAYVLYVIMCSLVVNPVVLDLNAEFTLKKLRM